MHSRRFVSKLAFCLVVVGTPLCAVAAQVDLKGVTGLKPGLWSIVTHGTVHVMGYTEPFSKTLKQCVHAGQEADTIMPPGKGQCDRQETTVNGVMHWHMHCAAGDAVTDTSRVIHTTKLSYNVKCNMKVNNPPSTTDYTAKGHWQQAACQ